jgi:hypothetical protein
MRRVIFLKGDALFLKQRLGAVAIGAEIGGVDFDLGHGAKIGAYLEYFQAEW